MPLASARQHPENQKENQAGHSSERTVEGQGRGDRPWVHSPKAKKKWVGVAAWAISVQGPSLVMRTPHARSFRAVRFARGSPHLAGSHLSYGAYLPRAPPKPATPPKQEHKKKDAKERAPRLPLRF